MIYYFLQSEYKNGLLEVQNNLDSALWSHPYETRMIKTQFLFKNQCQQGNLQVLVPGTANAFFMKQSQNKRRGKKKNKQRASVILNIPIPLPKGKEVSPNSKDILLPGQLYTVAPSLKGMCGECPTPSF